MNTIDFIMLKKLTQLKNKMILLNVYNKLNVYSSKIYKNQVINHLIIIYSNIKNNIIKLAPFHTNEFNIRNLYFKLAILLLLLEAVAYIY